MDLIIITPHKDDEGRECLKMELTIDGATKLEDNNDTDFSGLYDSVSNPADTEKLRISQHGAKIFTAVTIDWEESIQQPIKEWHIQKEHMGIFITWLKNPKSFFLYYPDEKNNKERKKEIDGKVAATIWATYCRDSIADALLEVNNRYNRLKVVYENLRTSTIDLNYKAYDKQDREYRAAIDVVCESVEKELEYCLQRTRLVKSISADLYSTTPVNQQYKLFRDEKQQKEEPATSTQGNDGGSIGEVPNNE